MATEMPLDDGASPSRGEQSPSRPKASFRTLPPELRLMIWEAACIPFARKDGVHYIDIDMIEEDNGNEGSAYTRDMGLWNTCRESRYAIAAHYHLDFWRLALIEPLDSIEIQRAIQTIQETHMRPIVCFIPRNPRFEEGQSRDNCFFIVAFGPFNEDIKSIYHRFCIRTSSPGSLIERIKRLNLYLPMVKGPREIELVRDWKLALTKASRARNTWQTLAADRFPQGLFIIGKIIIGRD